MESSLVLCQRNFIVMALWPHPQSQTIKLGLRAEEGKSARQTSSLNQIRDLPLIPIFFAVPSLRSTRTVFELDSDDILHHLLHAPDPRADSRGL